MGDRAIIEDSAGDRNSHSFPLPRSGTTVTDHPTRDSELESKSLQNRKGSIAFLLDTPTFSHDCVRENDVFPSHGASARVMNPLDFKLHSETGVLPRSEHKRKAVCANGSGLSKRKSTQETPCFTQDQLIEGKTMLENYTLCKPNTSSTRSLASTLNDSLSKSSPESCFLSDALYTSGTSPNLRNSQSPKYDSTLCSKTCESPSNSIYFNGRLKDCQIKYPNCPMTLNTIEKLGLHMMKHEADDPNKCGFCSFTTSTKTAMEAHVKMHDSEDCKCPTFHQEFHTGTASRHDTKGPKKMSKRNFHDTLFGSKKAAVDDTLVSNLTEISRMIDNDAIDERGKRNCSVYSKNLAMEGSLGCNTGEESQCLLRGPVVSSEGSFKKHTILHSSLNLRLDQKVSEDCHLNKAPLRKTKASVGTKYLCKPCQKKFSLDQLLDFYFKLHQNDLCAVCKKYESSKTLLNVHLISHIKNTPFRCPDCWKYSRADQHDGEAGGRNIENDVEYGTTERIATLDGILKKSVPQCSFDRVLGAKSVVLKSLRDFNFDNKHSEPTLVNVISDHPTISSDSEESEGQYHRVSQIHSSSDHERYAAEEDLSLIECTMTRSDISTKLSSKSDFIDPHQSLSFTGQVERPLRCRKCRARFASKQEMAAHLESHEIAKHECLDCQAKFITEEEFRDHIKSHRAAKFECSFCNRRFTFKENYTGHLKTHETQNSFSCHVCEEKLESIFQLTEHMKCHKKVIRCTVCSVTVSSNKSLKAHMKAHKSKTSYPCLVCKKEFPSNAALRRHSIIHSGEKFSCIVCNKVLASSISLKDHMSKHTPADWENQPDLMKLVYLEQAEDSQTNSTEKQFECIQCSERFNLFEKLMYHVSFHSGEKLFPCEFCPKIYGNQESLKNHLEWHARFPCIYCGKKLTSRNHFITHMRAHEGRPRFECGVCKRRLSSKQRLLGHLQAHAKQNDIPNLEM